MAGRAYITRWTVKRERDHLPGESLVLEPEEAQALLKAGAIVEAPAQAAPAPPSAGEKSPAEEGAGDVMRTSEESSTAKVPPPEAPAAKPARRSSKPKSKDS